MPLIQQRASSEDVDAGSIARAVVTTSYGQGPAKMSILTSGCATGFCCVFGAVGKPTALQLADRAPVVTAA